MKKFEVGKTYSTRSACDHECIFSYKIISRTEKTVKIKDKFGDIVSRRIKIWDDSEHIMPDGSYSMAPCLTAK